MRSAFKEDNFSPQSEWRKKKKGLLTPWEKFVANPLIIAESIRMGETWEQDSETELNIRHRKLAM